MAADATAHLSGPRSHPLVLRVLVDPFPRGGVDTAGDTVERAQASICCWVVQRFVRVYPRTDGGPQRGDCISVALDLRTAELYLDWSGFGHARDGWAGYAFSCNDTRTNLAFWP